MFLRNTLLVCGALMGMNVIALARRIYSPNSILATRKYLQKPDVYPKLADSSGINTVGTGIGHDIVATLDNDNNRFFVLNDFYQGELNNYQRGGVRFQLPELEPCTHTLKIKAWDVLNNSNEVVLKFMWQKMKSLN
jgi:hypothetical protein